MEASYINGVEFLYIYIHININEDKLKLCFQGDFFFLLQGDKNHCNIRKILIYMCGLTRGRKGEEAYLRDE